MRVFLDANILFSAAKSNGSVRRLLHEMKAFGHTVVADAYVIEEARRNLEGKYPSALADLDEIIATLDMVALVNPAFATEPLPLPDKDQPVLAAAIELHCDILLTGDKKHFGVLYGKTIQGVTVHPPQGLVACPEWNSKRAE